jgi:zinc protease
VVLRPGFDAGEADRTRGEILASIEQARDDPGSLVSRNLASVLYPGTRVGLPRGGTAETVANLGSEQARVFHERVFVPNNAIFFAAGDVDADDLLERVGAGFGSWMAGAEIEPGPPFADPAPPQPTLVVVDRPDLAQAHITLAHEGIARTDPRRVEASLLNSVVGGSGFSSRLMRRVRSEAGLTYGVSSGFTMRRGGGIFSISTSTRVPEARRVIDLILAEIELARSEPPTERELEGAKALAIGGFSLALETSDAVVGALVDLDLYGLPTDSLDTYRPRVRATTTAGAAELARALLHPERFAVVVVGPAAALTSQLEGLGPIEIRQP